MSEHVEQNADGDGGSHAPPWPRAVAGLAVAAHISIALAVWQAPKPTHYADDQHVAVALSILLAQANLLAAWLIVGYGPAIRRIGWSVCGWSGIAFILATGAMLESAAPFLFTLQALVTGSVLAMLRLSRRRVISPSTADVCYIGNRFSARQFSILELFGAALAVAIAAALLIRIDDAATFAPLGHSDTLRTVLAVSLPAALFTLVSVLGLRSVTSLSIQLVLSGAVLVIALALRTNPHADWDGLFVIHSAHWFVVAATLWIFRMCGYRLVRTTKLRSDG